MHFVDDHMLQLLIVDWSKVGVCFVRLSGDPGGQHVFARVIESVLYQEAGHVLDF